MIKIITYITDNINIITKIQFKFNNTKNKKNIKLKLVNLYIGFKKNLSSIKPIKNIDIKKIQIISLFLKLV